jgi:hypothetical protein
VNQTLEPDLSHRSWGYSETLPELGKNELAQFFAELKAASCLRVAIAYGVVGWLLTQVATQVLPFFEIPKLGGAILCAAGDGFPRGTGARLGLDLTPEGIRRAEDVPPNEYTPRWSKRKFAAITMSVAILAAAVPLSNLVGPNRPGCHG